MRYSNRENKLQSLPCFEKELVGCLTTVLSLSNEKSRLGVIWTAEGRRRQTVCDKRDNNYVRKKKFANDHLPFNRSCCERAGPCFSKVPVTFRSPKSRFMLAVFAFTNKVSIIFDRFVS